jgi:pSer/pThr/pTyr-binding forkhead associated (FHA) protein
MPGESLKILTGAGAGTHIPMQADFVVGRAEPGIGALAGDSEISRRHARFHPTAYGQVILEDLGSTNGTHVNGQRLGGPHVLAPGDQIRLGQTILQFDGAAQAQPAPIAPGVLPQPSAPPPTRSRPTWLPWAAVVVAALIVAGAVIAVIASSGSDSGKTAAQQSGSTPAQSAPRQQQKPAVRSVPALEASLKSTLAGPASTPPRVTSVSCPSDAPAETGASFTCQVSGQQGLKGTAKVTLKDSQRKAYSFKAVLFAPGLKRTISGSAS